MSFNGNLNDKNYCFIDKAISLTVFRSSRISSRIPNYLLIVSY